jgi:SAM-dependent methyltransferase
MDVQGHTLAELRDLTEAMLAIASAHEAGLFQALSSGPADAETLAGRLELDPRATTIICQALAEMGLLEDTDRGYRPTKDCQEELCDPDAPGYVAGGLSHWLSSMRAWVRLEEVIRQGGPLEKRPERRDATRVGRFMSAMAAAPTERIQRIVELCLQRKPDARTVLDVGGGPGHMSRAFVDRGVSATLLDTPDIVGHVMDAYGLGHMRGLHVVPGDFHQALPPGPFDVVLLSNVLHIYAPERNRALLARTADTLTPGGVVAVAEFLRGRSPRAARFGIQMLLHTDEGDAYDQEELSAWLSEAGFAAIEVTDVDAQRQLVTAVKP